MSIMLSDPSTPVTTPRRTVRPCPRQVNDGALHFPHRWHPDFSDWWCPGVPTAEQRLNVALSLLGHASDLTDRETRVLAILRGEVSL